ncbi:hypothetical protein TRV_01010 [Trichophyton verrucosum HKI 0517]|uniref:Alpha-galactosidase A n=1 Tax=Trichophyton verrucosum (strain HKI 0517) TaxID=663202 RepID=D4D1R7_TRIVH|nr:uncharacterized protein TRV_01010 [Trichophyton verrucosum HKI 0517]EFE44234.1 hypothetical protein TRV_01010 [Trichophyton verrucosum HKI 0517]
MECHQSMPVLSMEAKEWNTAFISRDPSTSKLETRFSNRKLGGVHEIWHPNSVDCLTLTIVIQLSANASEVTVSGNRDSSDASTSLGPQATAILKIARFEWEIPRIVQETRAYKLLEESGLAPRFLGHVHEHGRVIGILVEKIEGREASIGDLPVCKDVVQQFHKLGLLHGDVNKYNFIIGSGTAKLIDFENSRAHLDDCSAMQSELDSLETQLQEKTGRGGGFMSIENPS